MAQDVVVNGTTYPAVEAVSMNNANGNTTMYYPDAVRYVEQTLTDAQKEKARDNIGAVATSDVNTVVNAALTEAKASGEFDGKDGKTPEKGVDYFTEADKAAMVQAVLDALGGTPVFGTVDALNNIVLTGKLEAGVYTLKYEDADGNVTEIGTLNHNGKDEPVYVNALSLAVDSDGTPYNGGKGYKTGYRLNSSSVEAAKEGMEVTGFIPVKAGDVLYLYNIGMKTDSENKGNMYIYCYNSNFGNVAECYFRMDSSSAAIANGSIVLDASNNVAQIHINKNLYPNLNDSAAANIAYLRFSADEITDTSVITINQEFSQ